MKISLKSLEKISQQDAISPELHLSVRMKRKFLMEKVKIIDKILSKPVEKNVYGF